jgi:hypothetical protein
VGIPKGHKFWGVGYEEANVTNDELAEIQADVHGGLTYSDKGDDGWWYFGFDTAHSVDFTPKIVELLIETNYEFTDNGLRFHDCMNYKTWEFVEDQIYWLGKRLWAYNEYEKEDRHA